MAALPEAEVLEVLRLFDRGMPIPEIAPKFLRSEQAIKRIVFSQSRRDVTCAGHKPEADCDCRGCRYYRLQDKNIDAADRAGCSVTCLQCGGKVMRLAWKVQRAGGLVLCTQCEGRGEK
jgi:hypothetical protein